MSEPVIPRTVGPYEVDAFSFLGQGSYGWVLGGTDTRTNTPVALKFCKRDIANSFRSFDIELRTLRAADHPNIVAILHYDATPSFNVIVLELCFSNLTDIFASPEPPTDLEHKFIRELLNAVSHLHSNDIIHRDIKPDNILIRKLATGVFVVKLTDFGLSTRMPADHSSCVTATAGAGTFLWMAPEVYPDEDGQREARYGKPSDCWSCGHIAYSLFCHATGQPLPPPVKGPRGEPYGEYVRELLDADAPVPALEVPLSGLKKQLVQGLLHHDSRSRCKIADAIAMMQEISDADAARSGARPREPSDHSSIPTPSAADAAVVQSGARPRLSPQPSPARGSFRQSSVHQSTRQHSLAPYARSGSRPHPTLVRSSTQLSHAPDAAVAQSEARPRSSPQPSPALGCVVKLEKLGKIRLPVSGAADLRFGQGNFLVGFKDDQNLYWYNIGPSGFELTWSKHLPRNQILDCYKIITPRGEFFLQSRNQEVSLFGPSLELIRTVPTPGDLICLLPGGERVLVGNHCSSSTLTEGVRLRVAASSNLATIHHQLAVPEEGPYSREDYVMACGREDGWLAVTVYQKATVDIYDAEGRHVVRGMLPRHAAWNPSCTRSCVLVPLYGQPWICVMTWSGQVTHILGHRELGLAEDDWCHVVSPVHQGRIHVCASGPGYNEVRTYAFEEARVEEESVEEERDQ